MKTAQIEDDREEKRTAQSSQRFKTEDFGQTLMEKDEIGEQNSDCKDATRYYSA